MSMLRRVKVRAHGWLSRQYLTMRRRGYLTAFQLTGNRLRWRYASAEQNDPATVVIGPLTFFGLALVVLLIISFLCGPGGGGAVVQGILLFVWLSTLVVLAALGRVLWRALLAPRFQLENATMKYVATVETVVALFNKKKAQFEQRRAELSAKVRAGQLRSGVSDGDLSRLINCDDVLERYAAYRALQSDSAEIADIDKLEERVALHEISRDQIEALRERRGAMLQKALLRLLIFGSSALLGVFVLCWSLHLRDPFQVGGEAISSFNFLLFFVEFCLKGSALWVIELLPGLGGVDVDLRMVERARSAWLPWASLLAAKLFFSFFVTVVVFEFLKLAFTSRYWRTGAN